MKHHLSAIEIAQLAGTQKTHFLNANAQRLNKSLGDATGLHHLGIHWVEIAPGHVSTELHRHHHEEEAVYVLQGEGTVQLDEDVVPVSSGDFVGLPVGGPAHAFANTGTAPLRLLVIGERLGYDVGDYPALKKRLYRYGNRWDLVDLDAIGDPKKAHPGAGSK
jgi:uncharacterized cupin superfamily protein